VGRGRSLPELETSVSAGRSLPELEASVGASRSLRDVEARKYAGRCGCSSRRPQRTRPRRDLGFVPAEISVFDRALSVPFLDRVATVV
jgi:hypothetical protein